MSKETKSDIINVYIRMEPELHAQVKELALQDTRSLNSEIIVLLREAIRARRKG